LPPRVQLEGGIGIHESYAADILELGRLLHRKIGGLLPLENSAGIITHETIGIGNDGSVTHQTAGRGELALLVDRRNGMLRRERHDLIASADEIGVGADQDRRDLPLRKHHERRIDLALVARIHNVDLLPQRPRCGMHVVQLGGNRWSVWVDEHADQRRGGDQFMQQCQPFAPHLADEDADSGGVAAGPVEAGDEAKLHRVFGADENDWDDRGCCLCRKRRALTAGGGNHRNADFSKIDRQRRQSIVMTLGPALAVL
jgi:hypothetical protein